MHFRAEILRDFPSLQSAILLQYTVLCRPVRNQVFFFYLSLK